MAQDTGRAVYDKLPYEIGANTSVLQCERESCKTVDVRRSLPGNIIVVHGVNDLGVSYDKVEQGLCEGLGRRLGRKFTPATYRMPQIDDKGKLYEDPDAIFFKRSIDKTTDSPVIPFYWGFAEKGQLSRVKNGQHTDRYGNRLDKDLSKGGGPFGNATNTLPDMWNRGFNAMPGDLLDALSRDALRPVLKAPGRMYMVLAAKRLAALIAMIRDYEKDDTVSIVAHSQGCMLSLLAQAFLLEMGLRPADTLVLTHPPYSLVSDAPFTTDFAEMFSGGEDAAMAGNYHFIGSRQSGNARLQTLVNLVKGVAGARHATPAFDSLGKASDHEGILGNGWLASADRDNRGKVYLYFCPEDMTVALDNVQGIGWQGVPEAMSFQAIVSQKPLPGQGFFYTGPTRTTVNRRPLEELGKGFFQRVFTAKRRVGADGKPGPVLVGQAPHDFVLKLKGEDEHAHVAPGSATMRARLPEEKNPDRAGIRKITGEALRDPVLAVMHEGAHSLPGQPQGAHEEVDPVDAAIALTSDYGLTAWELIADPQQASAPAELASLTRNSQWSGSQLLQSPHPPAYQGWVWRAHQRKALAQEFMNRGKDPAQHCKVLEVFFCLRGQLDRRPTGMLLVKCEQSPDQARLRWQRAMSPRSFHGAIFGSRANHAQVTAYDVAIGRGKASSHPQFYLYLCAVADWRMKIPNKSDRLRPSILLWEKFTKKFAAYWDKEPAWRKKIIEGNAKYYSTGDLPAFLPVLPGDLPPTVICETTGLPQIPSKGSKKT